MPKYMDDVLMTDVMHELFGRVEERINDELWQHIADGVCETPMLHIRWGVKDSITGEHE